MRWGQWRLWARVRGFLVLGGLAAASAAAAAPPQIPAAWLAYAAQASDALGQRLARSDDADVVRFQTWLQQHPHAAHAEVLAVSLWIDGNGTITRSQFASLGDAQVDADLRALLASTRLPSAPPPEMRQPLRLGLSLQPDADADVAP